VCSVDADAPALLDRDHFLHWLAPGEGDIDDIVSAQHKVDGRSFVEHAALDSDFAPWLVLMLTLPIPACEPLPPNNFELADRLDVVDIAERPQRCRRKLTRLA
jgi:hypothetical protein